MDFGHILNKQFFYISSGHIYSWNRVDRHRSRWDIHNLQNWISDTFCITRTLKKICKDRYCSRRDIRILKNGFQTHLHNQTIDKKREDRHRSRWDIHILKNGFQIYFHDQNMTKICKDQGRRNRIISGEAAKIFPQRAREGVLIFEFYCSFTH